MSETLDEAVTSEETAVPVRTDADVLDPAKLDLSGVEGEETVADPESFRERFAAYVEDMRKAVSEAKRFTNSTAKVSKARVLFCMDIVLGTGYPDWNAGSALYRSIISEADARLTVDLARDAKQSLDAAARQQKRRKWLMPAIVWHVIAREDGFPEEREKVANESTLYAGQHDGAELSLFDNSALRDVLRNPSESLKHRVWQHYASAGLTVPTAEFPAFKHAGENPGGGGGEGGDENPTNPLETLTGALSGMGDITPRWGVAGLLMSATAVFEKIISETGEIGGRDAAEEQLRRVAVLATVAAKSLAGKAREEDVTHAKSLAWDSTKDTPDA